MYADYDMFLRLVGQQCYRLDVPWDNTIDVGDMTEFVQDFCYDRICLPKKASRQGFGTSAGSIIISV